jgi:hypothetical protein
VAIWYISPNFGILCQEKSGNPGRETFGKFIFVVNFLAGCFGEAKVTIFQQLFDDKTPTFQICEKTAHPFFTESIID